MSQEKIDSYFQSQEFPGLSHVVGELRRQLDEIHVKRIDTDFVNKLHKTKQVKKVGPMDDEVDFFSIDDIRLLDIHGVEVDRVNQRQYYKTPVTWWNPWTWYRYSREPHYCTQRPIWFFDKPQHAKSIREWLLMRSLPHIHFVYHFTPSSENKGRLKLVIRKVPKSSGESRERMSLQMYIDFLIIQEQREERLHREKLVNEIAAEIAAVDAEPSPD